MRSFIILMFGGLLFLALSCADRGIEIEEITPVPPEPLAILLSASNYEILPHGFSTYITATLVDESGDILGGGYSILFEITDAPAMEGDGSPSFDYPPSNDTVLHEYDAVTDVTGKATVRLRSGTEPGTVRIRASYSGENYINTEQDLITITPHPVGMINLFVEYGEIYANGHSTIIWAEVKNTWGEPVGSGYGIRFEITEAPALEGPESPSFNYPATDDSVSTIFETETDSNGQAQVILFSGTMGGLVEIKATYIENENIYNTAFILIHSAQLAGITLSSDLNEIPVGYNSTGIYATVLDEFGNPLGEGYEIRFEITDEISPRASFVQPGDTAIIIHYAITDDQGQASVALYSYTESGMVYIRATSLDDESIFAEEPLVQFLAGPPFVIIIGGSNIAYAEDEAIITYIHARVCDQYTNWVEPLTAVYFDLIPDTIAFIEGVGYTGGWVDENGDTVGVRGLTEVMMAYSCYHTFDTVRITANSGDAADTSPAFILPIYDGSISADADPGVLFVAPPAGNYEESEIMAQLTDGLDCPIHNGIILFSVSGCGEIAPDAQQMDTTDDQGYAYTTFRIYYEQIPERQPPLPPACNAHVKARLRGYPDIEANKYIFCTVTD